ncbi:MAG: response regulator [Deltaproteobacteria bacterium]|nr:response regulator [Deltaproteobacteria bacterium]MCL5277634.1 response regulator [Deltaproteobacteria bacterium]
MEKKRYKVLIVDDEPLVVRLIKEAIEPSGYETASSPDGNTALRLVKEYKPDTILLDGTLPDMSGYDVLRKLKASHETWSIPAIIITALGDRNSKYEALNIGADDFLNKPFDIDELRIRINNSIKVKAYNDLLNDYNNVLEKTVREKTKELNAALQDLQTMNETLKHAYHDTVFRLTRAAEYKDEFTGGHLKRISAYSSLLGEYMGISKSDRGTIVYASPMHDIGKIGIPDHILQKNSPLTAGEFEIIKGHTTIGATILQDAESDVLRMGQQIALTHHERWDGTGYPRGLKGTKVPLIGRIVMLVDQYDALRSKRPYKSPLSHEQVYDIITRGDGRTMPQHFDPGLLEVFKKLSDRFDGIYVSFHDEDTVP